MSEQYSQKNQPGLNATPGQSIEIGKMYNNFVERGGVIGFAGRMIGKLITRVREGGFPTGPGYSTPGMMTYQEFLQSQQARQGNYEKKLDELLSQMTERKPEQASG